MNQPHLLKPFFGYQAGNSSSGINNTANGYQALFSNTTGTDNTALGYQAAFSGVTASFNTALGASALKNNTYGTQNVAVGSEALFTQSYNGDMGGGPTLFASDNVAIGYRALYLNQPTATTQSGTQNVAVGSEALGNNTTGYWNVAVGHQALYSNTTAFKNVAVGFQALNSNQTTSGLTAVGTRALTLCTGAGNTAVGHEAAAAVTTGTYNTVLGFQSLNSCETGNYNVAIGASCLQGTTGDYNTAVGMNAGNTNTSGSNNTFIGYLADANAGNLSNATAIGNSAIVDANNKIRLGNGSVTVLEGSPATWSTPSDLRFKYNIAENEVKGLDFIKKLRPVVYNFDSKKYQEFITRTMPENKRRHYIDSVDFKPSTDIRQTGFIAQEVEKAAIETGFNFSGINKPFGENGTYSLAYSQFVVPLVKAVQEQQEMIENQEDVIEKQKKRLDAGKSLLLEMKTTLEEMNLETSTEAIGKIEQLPFDSRILKAREEVANLRKVIKLLTENENKRQVDLE